MKSLIFLAVVAFASARPQLIFLIASGPDGSLQTLDPASLNKLHQSLSPLVNTFQQQQVRDSGSSLTSTIAEQPASTPSTTTVSASTSISTSAPAVSEPVSTTTPAVAEPSVSAVEKEVAPIASTASPADLVAKSQTAEQSPTTSSSPSPSPVGATPSATTAPPSQATTSIVNLVDPQFRSFIFPNDPPEIVAAKVAHFTAFQQALRRNTLNFGGQIGSPVVQSPVVTNQIFGGGEVAGPQFRAETLNEPVTEPEFIDAQATESPLFEAEQEVTTEYDLTAF